MAKQLQEAAPTLEPLNPVQARSRARQLTDIFIQRFWNRDETREAYTLAEYLEAHKEAETPR